MYRIVLLHTHIVVGCLYKMYIYDNAESHTSTYSL